MHRLPFIIVGLLIQALSIHGQSPHGPDFVVNCATCHSPQGWEVDMDSLRFDHDTTAFALEGEHANVACKSCHVTLVFKETASDCISCHTDIHSMSVGNDCARCHNSQSWLVDNIPEIHEQNGFALVGVHSQQACIDCHLSETHLRFDRIGNDCINCHREDYDITVEPDHNTSGFSLDCADCHDAFSAGWNTEFVNHDFFPLIQGHDIPDCAACHNVSNFSDISADCISCHTEDFASTTNPDHSTSGFSTDCASCHMLEPGWMPAVFADHDAQFFPIYSGEHQGVWSDCIECHKDPNNFASFTCIECHTNPETDDEHQGVQGYVYNDNACLACHPVGSAEMAFDHNTTNFPLTGAHIGIECLECHVNNLFEGTSTQCIDCHTMDFTNTVNPDHQEINLSTDCASCHTTDPEWMPARFDIHNEFYPLVGAHAVIANDCISCHNGEYTSTPTECIVCHRSDYDNTTDPNHLSAQFPTDCAQCHNESAWEPASFEHDANYFPINSGDHNGVWTECVECHQNPNNFGEFTCIACHTNPETDDEHQGISGYRYEDNACLTCHPTGSADMAFDHNATNFPLTGAHIGLECLECHSGGYQGTSTACVDCHTMDFTNAVNPNHQQINLSTDCASCHTTEPGWMPARFDIHDEFFPLMGAHATISNDCAACHQGDYINTPADCIGCHADDYNNTTNPNHASAQFPTDCAQCHGESSWLPSTFEHDGMYFPIYSGEHQGVWTDCRECHANPNNFAEFTCIECHTNPETDEEHLGVSGYVYQDNACLACHPTGSADMAFDHNTTNFPLTESHLGVECLECHVGGQFEGTSSACVDCHTIDFNGSTNPNHQQLSLSNDCIVCHTAAPDWMPAQFDIHDQYYALNGAHAAIATNCAICHNGDYVNTPNDCYGCHQTDYDNTTSPDHQSAQFPTNCDQCHTESAWAPADFNHEQFYELTGAHADIANNCTACHADGFENTPNQCIGCHLTDYNNANDPDHQAAQFPTNCEQCHNTREWDPADFNHDALYFPIYSGNHQGEWNSCTECHTNPNNYPLFSCIDCHEHSDKNDVDDDHDDVSGYVYESNACYACHPNGEE